METTEGNKLIAEFMGYERVIRPSSLKGINSLELYIKDNENYVQGEISYHSSWDWLMPVVNKIESLNYEVHIYHSCCDINAPDDIQNDAYVIPIASFCNPEANSKINATWQSVVTFIQWYNSQSTQTP